MRNPRRLEEPTEVHSSAARRAMRADSWADLIYSSVWTCESTDVDFPQSNGVNGCAHSRKISIGQTRKWRAQRPTPSVEIVKHKIWGPR